jgi:CPA1 family monovalent cation:H+ antiporter
VAPDEEVYNDIRKQLNQHALLYLNSNCCEQVSRQPMLQQMALKWQNNDQLADGLLMTEESKSVYRDVLDLQRKWLINKNKEDVNIDEEIIRRHLLYLDLEEEKLQFI